MGPPVPREVVRQRLGRLSEALLSAAEVALAELLGRRVEVLIDQMSPTDAPLETVAVGRTRGQAPDVDGATYLLGPVRPGLSPGDLRWATVEEVAGVDLIARLD
jgi:tRNA A37 methylthiotransferase MiaB